ncbi:MAG: Di-and tricarboxylate transporter [Gemmatimonadetes bacterium]|nr:Di-and tricarboxylate transporter [Gemmatimonadota bacterium]
MGGRSIGGSGSPEATPGHSAPAGLDQPAPSTAGRPGPAKLRHLLAGPIIFAVLLLAPLDGLAFETRGAMGLLVWMAWWWIARPVHLAVTGLLPLPIAAIFGLAPMDEVATSYAQDTILLLLGANILTSVWTQWGLDRRIGLGALLSVGTDASRQILVWFLVSAALSSVLPNTIVAATMIPIVVAMLRSIGIEDLWNSRVGTALVIAVAWGTSAGGAATPLGGAPNLLAVGFIEESITGQEFLFLTWALRIAPITAVIVLVMFLFLRFVMRPDVATLPGSEDYIRDEVRALGPMQTEEKWGLVLFTVATVLAFGRPLYADLVPGLTPAFAFVAMAVASFTIRTRKGPLITWAFAQSHMYWGLFYLFAGGIALGRILSGSGAAEAFANALVPYASSGGFVAVLVFSLATMVLTQVTSNTAAIAIVVPITISTFQSLGLNPIPFVYIVAVVGNCGFVLPSSAGGPAIAAGYGVNLQTMAVKGLFASVLLLVTLVLLGYALARWWPAFGVA